MRRIQHIPPVLIGVILLMSLALGSHMLPVRADTTNGPSLVISQLKLTSSNGQFITLYNSSGTTLDMSKYQLEYFNSFDLSKATSSRLIALTGTVPPHGYYMVNDSMQLLCYQLTINSVSLGLSSTAGMVEVLAFNQSSPGSPVVPVLQDYIGWSKTAASGAQTLPSNLNAFLQRQPADGSGNPIVTAPGSGSWQTVQPDSANPCNTTTTTTVPTTVPTGLSQLLPPTEAPASIVTTPADGGTADPAAAPAVLPASDIGLMSPQITELLPNPMGTGNDATEEFIELHNPNPGPFDLSGFSLQVGTTTLRTYKFPAGTSLPGASFKAFTAEETSLSLSNSGSQAKLLDPPGTAISTAEVYGTAKDGQAWALAKGKWYWTTKLTPNAANVIELPPAKKTAAAKKPTTAKQVKGAQTIKPKAKTTTATAGAGFTEDPPTTPIHPWVLALIAGLALLYGAYEYRADIRNRLYRLRQHFGGRRQGGP